MKKLFTALLISTMISQPTFAAVLQQNVINCNEETKLEVNRTLDSIPDEIMNQFYESGGKITFKDSIRYQGKDVKGIYYQKTNEIEVVNDELNYHYLAHEIGHFIYSKSKITNDDKNELNLLYSVFGMYGPPFTSTEETFAELYAFTKTGYGGYYLNQNDYNLIKRIEKSVSEQYDKKSHWENENGIWYLKDYQNNLLTGWNKVNGIWYFLDQDGKLLLNTTTPDGYRVDQNGAWMKDL